jgi:hypothetical protein
MLCVYSLHIRPCYVSTIKNLPTGNNISCEDCGVNYMNFLPGFPICNQEYSMYLQWHSRVNFINSEWCSSFAEPTRNDTLFMLSQRGLRYAYAESTSAKRSNDFFVKGVTKIKKKFNTIYRSYYMVHRWKKGSTKLSWLGTGTFKLTRKRTRREVGWQWLSGKVSRWATDAILWLFFWAFKWHRNSPGAVS